VGHVRLVVSATDTDGTANTFSR
ncbi:MAG: hypothetical protein QOC92_372, partial [Acidimicrobiaceae bacterium]